MASDPGWGPPPGTFPWPPANLQVVSPFFTGAYDVRWDDPSLLNTGPATTLTAASATVQVDGTVRTLTAATGSFEVTSAPVPAGETLIVDTVVLTCVHGAPGADEFDGSGSSADAVASSIAAAINGGSVAGFGVATATASGSTVDLEAVTPGAAGNYVVLDSSSPLVLVSGGFLSGGYDADTLTVGNVTLSATLSERTPGGRDFKVGPTSFDTAESITAALSDPLNYGSFVAAYASGGAVVLQAAVYGSEGNAIVLDTTSDALLLSGSSLAGGSGGPECAGQSNSSWTIVGVNVYRSDNGERGPYVRVNRLPVGSLFYRDSVDLALVQDEVIRWDGSWISKGDSANDRRWIFQTAFRPIVKPLPAPVPGRSDVLQAVPANSPHDVSVRIDGVVVLADSVFGPLGQVTLVNRPYHDPVRQVWVPPRLPAADGSSEVVITYRYSRNAVQSKLDRTTQTFYRVTTVALDPASPSGYVETPLEYSPPVSVSQVESFDYIWREAVYRNAWILQQGGERVKLFKRRVSGIPCPCLVDAQTLEYGKQPSNRCLTCLGTGFVGAYDGPVDIIIVPDEADRRIEQTPFGRRLDHQYEVWTGPDPSITQRDFIVKQTGERYAVGPVRRPAVRGLPLQQHFSIAYLDEGDVRYRMPVTGTTDLPWPQTRPTDPNKPCDPQPPHPVGFDYQATPMETEVSSMPDTMERRGRTPVWANIMNGGNG